MNKMCDCNQGRMDCTCKMDYTKLEARVAASADPAVIEHMATYLSLTPEEVRDQLALLAIRKKANQHYLFSRGFHIERAESQRKWLHGLKMSACRIGREKHWTPDAALSAKLALIKAKAELYRLDRPMTKARFHDGIRAKYWPFRAIMSCELNRAFKRDCGGPTDEWEFRPYGT